MREAEVIRHRHQVNAQQAASASSTPAPAPQPPTPGYSSQPQSYPSSAPQPAGNSSPIPAQSAQPLSSPTMDAIGNLFSEVKLNKGLPTKGQLLAIGKLKEKLCPN